MTKNLKNALKISIFTALLTSIFLIGCGKSITPTESALAYFDLFQKDEIKKETLPLNDKEAKDFIKETRKKTEENMKKEFSDSGITSVPKEALDDIINNMVKVNKKISPKAEEISKEGDTAVVKLTTKKLDDTASNKIYEESIQKLSEKDQEDPAVHIKLYQDYMKHLADNVNFSDKDVSIEVTMKKVNNKWIIDSEKELDKLNTLTSAE